MGSNINIVYLELKTIIFHICSKWKILTFLSFCEINCLDNLDSIKSETICQITDGP